MCHETVQNMRQEHYKLLSLTVAKRSAVFVTNSSNFDIALCLYTEVVRLSYLFHLSL
jgi:hypothetical protein